MSVDVGNLLRLRRWPRYLTSKNRDSSCGHYADGCVSAGLSHGFPSEFLPECGPAATSLGDKRGDRRVTSRAYSIRRGRSVHAHAYTLTSFRFVAMEPKKRMSECCARR